jgi:hypothetical protein
MIILGFLLGWTCLVGLLLITFVGNGSGGRQWIMEKGSIANKGGDKEW